MIDALISGRIHRAPQARSSNSGKRYATATVRTATRDGNALFVNVIAFEESAANALLALSDGDSVALAGELTPKVYTPQNGEPRPSLDLLAHAVLTEYHVARKRRAVQGGGNRSDTPFDDPLPSA
jgi:single-stranded DNA-binding protein